MKGVSTTCFSFLRRLRNGHDDGTWREFHARYGVPLYHYARRRGVTHNDAEDIVQEFEMRFYRTVDEFRYDAGRGRFRGYLAVSIGRILRGWRARGRRMESTIDPKNFASISLATDANQDSHRLQRLRDAMHLIRSEFDPITMEAFRMYALAERPAKQTADTLGIAVASVYQAKTRILKRLRAILQTDAT